MSYKGRDRATQLVKDEQSVEFTKHTLLLSSHEHEQRDSADERIAIVTDKYWSAVNCAIKVGIVPFSSALFTDLSISQITNCCQQKNTNRETAQTLSLVLQARH